MSNWLLDVNTLVALAHQGHSDHTKLIRWVTSLMDSPAKLWTCSFTEIAFVRISVQVGFEKNVPDAVATLVGLKQTSPIPFDILSDNLGADQLPSYVLSPKQVTDGHLLNLAHKFSMQLATLDKGIPGACLIM
jgi:predicted nucleic acid-binding protein